MTSKTIIEMEAKPGQRGDLLKALDDLHEKRRNAPGFIGFTRYEVIDDPDKLIEITEWESPEARQAWLEQSMSSGVFQRLIETLKQPFKAVTVRQIE
ncbi:MAG: antibiotic biosynthesis monooxygenase [Chloroflexota bacterium]|jgi:quinol monooxygenase YgiN